MDNNTLWHCEDKNCYKCKKHWQDELLQNYKSTTNIVILYSPLALESNDILHIIAKKKSVKQADGKLNKC